MTKISELPATDMTKFKLETFFSQNPVEVSGAGLYLLELANGEEYVDDMISFEYLKIIDDIETAYYRIRDYFEINLPDTPVKNTGTLIDIIAGYDYNRLIEIIRSGSGMLNITGSVLPSAPKRRVALHNSHSIFLVDYFNNRKVNPIGTKIEVMILQEFVREYELLDRQIMELCRLLKIDDLHKNYALLSNSNLLSVSDILDGEAYPEYVTATIESDQMPLVNKLITALKTQIKVIPLTPPTPNIEGEQNG